MGPGAPTTPLRKLTGYQASVVEGPSPPTAAVCPDGTMREDPPHSSILFAEFFAGTAELTRTLRSKGIECMWGRRLSDRRHGLQRPDRRGSTQTGVTRASVRRGEAGSALRATLRHLLPSARPFSGDSAQIGGVSRRKARTGRRPGTPRQDGQHHRFAHIRPSALGCP